MWWYCRGFLIINFPHRIISNSTAILFKLFNVNVNFSFQNFTQKLMRMSPACGKSNLSTRIGYIRLLSFTKLELCTRWSLRNVMLMFVERNIREFSYFWIDNKHIKRTGKRIAICIMRVFNVIQTLNLGFQASNIAANSLSLLTFMWCGRSYFITFRMIKNF